MHVLAGRAGSRAARLLEQRLPAAVPLVVVPLPTASTAEQDGLNTALGEMGLKMERGLQAVSVTSACVQANSMHNSAHIAVLGELLASERGVCLEMVL